jgi:hypothetical protein
MIFSDGLSDKIESSLEKVFDFYGYEYNYIGGGAGRVSFETGGCIFSNKGVSEDSTQLVFKKSRVSIGVSHGYEPVGESLRVTKCDRNIIKSLNYNPAFEVYQKILKNSFNLDITDENFQEYAKNFPFGISRIGGDFVVRDPLHTIGTDVRCIGELREDSFVYIMNATVDSLLKAAETAVEKSQTAKTKNMNLRFIVDCVSRYLHMEEDYLEEIATLSDGAENSIGILSIGEIANDGDGIVELYNKTCVVAELEV